MSQATRLRRDPAVRTSTHHRYRFGVLAVGLFAVLALLGACGGDDDGGAGNGNGDDAPAVEGGDVDAAAPDETDDAAPGDVEDVSSNSGGPTPSPDGPSAGLQVDEEWPAEIWVPSEVNVYGGSLNSVGDGNFHGNLFARTELSVEDLRDAILAGNGTPDEDYEHNSGAHILSYDGSLLAGHTVTFSLVEAPPMNGLTVTILTK